MTPAIRAGLAVLLVAAVAPEFTRYAAERRLSRASAVLKLALTDEIPIAQRGTALDWAAATAVEAGRHLVGDSRPWITAGSAQLVARRAEAALAAYREAFGCGERAEIDLNLGRASMMLNRRADAERALVRAVWVSPALLSALPDTVAPILRAEVDRLEAELREGRLPAPPPPP
jgi:hypothetical protein